MTRPPRRIDEPDHRRAGNRLSGAGLADDAQHLARRDVEGDAVDRLEHAAPRHELDAQIADGKDGLGHRRAIAGSGAPDQSAVI